MTIARRASAGDASALARLYSRYADPLFAFIYHHTPDSRQDTEDIWQDTWLAVLRSLRSYQGKSQFFTWLCAIARHKIADYYRRQQHNPVQLHSNSKEEQLSLIIEYGSLHDEILSQPITRTCVVEALATLSEGYRRALIARYADEESIAEVARRLGKNYKATESLLSRARAAFREALVHITED